MAEPTRPQRGELTGVATNVITGFLGAGKSTAILHLLQQKPEHERWAVLVNEFGEVGIDGNLLQRDMQQGVFVREVAGGCMCCASGIPMQIALTSLLSQARPDRLLIEPTGLGHPREVLALLGAEHYRRVLDLQATITLVDARKVRDPRYAEHATFVQQLSVADVIVANKADRYDPEDLPALRGFLARTEGLADKPLRTVERGALPLDLLARPAGEHDLGHHHHDHADESLPPTRELPPSGYLRIDNEGEGFFSQGWMFAPSWTFDADQVDAVLLGIDAVRIKAVFRTAAGIVAYNMADGVMTRSALAESADSRAEILSSDRATFDGLEQALLACVASRGDG